MPRKNEHIITLFCLTSLPIGTFICISSSIFFFIFFRKLFLKLVPFFRIVRNKQLPMKTKEHGLCIVYGEQKNGSQCNQRISIFYNRKSRYFLYSISGEVYVYDEKYSGPFLRITQSYIHGNIIVEKLTEWREDILMRNPEC